MSAGRPKSEDPRCRIIKIRVTEKEFLKLEKAAEEFNTTKSGIIRSALGMYFFRRSVQKTLEKSP